MDALVLASVIGPPVGIVLVLSFVLKIVLGSAKKSRPIPKPPMPERSDRANEPAAGVRIAPEETTPQKASLPISARIKKVLPSGLAAAATGGQAQVSEAEAADRARRDALAELVAAEHRRGMAADGGTGSLPQMVPVPAQPVAEPMKENASAGAWLDRPIRVSPEQAAVPHLVKAAEDDQIDFIDPDGTFADSTAAPQDVVVPDDSAPQGSEVTTSAVVAPEPEAAKATCTTPEPRLAPEATLTADELPGTGVSVPQVSEASQVAPEAPAAAAEGAPQMQSKAPAAVSPSAVAVDLAAAHREQLQVAAAARAESFQVLADLAVAPMRVAVRWAVAGSVFPQVIAGPWTNPALVRIDPVMPEDQAPMTGGHDVIVTSAAQANPVRSAAGTSDYEQIIDHLHDLAAQLSEVLTQVRAEAPEQRQAEPVTPIVEEYLAEFGPEANVDLASSLGATSSFDSEVSFDPPLPVIGDDAGDQELSFDPPLPQTPAEMSDNVSDIISATLEAEPNAESALVQNAPEKNIEAIIPIVRMAAPLAASNTPSRHAETSAPVNVDRLPVIPLAADAALPAQGRETTRDPLLQHLGSAVEVPDTAAVVNLGQSLSAVTGGPDLAFAPAPFVSLGTCAAGADSARIARRTQGRALAGQAVTHRIVRPEVTRWQNIVPLSSDKSESGADYSVSSRREGRVGFARQAERKAFEDSLERRKQLLFDGTDLAFESGYDECLN